MRCRVWLQIVSRLTPFLTADVTPYDCGKPKGVLLDVVRQGRDAHSLDAVPVLSSPVNRHFRHDRKRNGARGSP
jgi:hypothetical protein